METIYNQFCCKLPFTCKSLSVALLFAEHGENTLCTKIVLNVRKNFCTQHVFPRFELGIFMYWTCNLLSYCGLVDAKIRASDEDLPVINYHATQPETRYEIVQNLCKLKVVSYKSPLVVLVFFENHSILLVTSLQN